MLLWYMLVRGVQRFVAKSLRSVDSTARIWTISDGSSGSGMRNSLVNVLVLQHLNGRINQKRNSVLTLDWNVGRVISFTCEANPFIRFIVPVYMPYEGLSWKKLLRLIMEGSWFFGLGLSTEEKLVRVKEARIWNTNGESKSTLTEHRGSIDPVKWNKKGDYILTGSHDKTVIVWDVKSEECKQQFKFHTGQILDADWRDNVSLATSFTDGMIHVFKIGESHPISTFSGHQDKVNCVKWDPTGLLLASCSDDSLF